MRAQEMEADDIYDFVNSFVSLIDRQQAEFIREDIDAGEFENSVSNLVACLATDQTPVSQQDAEIFRGLLTRFKSPLNFMDKLVVR